MPNPQTNLRLDPAIRDRAIATAKGQGITVATLVERALTAYLDGSVAGDSTVVSDSGSDTRMLSEQIADLTARVEKLETDHFADVSKMVPLGSGANRPVNSAPPPPSPAPTGQSSTRAAPSGEGQHPRADGVRWLTTGQAVQISKARGGPDSRSTLLAWVEDGRLAQIGLRHCPHGTRHKMLASFEDLRVEG